MRDLAQFESVYFFVFFKCSRSFYRKIKDNRCL